MGPGNAWDEQTVPPLTMLPQDNDGILELFFVCLNSDNDVVVFSAKVILTLANASVLFTQPECAFHSMLTRGVLEVY